MNMILILDHVLMGPIKHNSLMIDVHYDKLFSTNHLVLSPSILILQRQKMIQL